MQPWFGEEEKIALNQYMEEGGWLTEFKQTEEFEKAITHYTGANHCIAVNNGTISLTLMAMAAGIKPGDEVLVPNYTMIATPNSLKLFGAIPVFVDVESSTLCMDVDLAREAITDKTKAIMFVNANGRNPAKGIEQFVDLCNEKGLYLLEDSAQSLGSFHTNGQHQGTYGLAGNLSFSAPKVISTGQGGAILTSNDDLAYRIRRLKDFGRSGGGNDIHDSIGYNFKFTDIQAVVGIEQMKKLHWRVNRKKRILQLYQEALKDVKEVSFFEQDLEITTPWFIDIMVEQRNELMMYLKEYGIGTRPMYPPINKQVAYNYPGEFEVSNAVGKYGLWLPSASQLKDEEIQYISETIRKYFNS